MTLLKVRNIEAGYGKAQILNGIDLDVEAREIVTIIGPNGCGKSTLLKSIMGFVPWRRGLIEFDGADITNERTDAVIRRGIGYVPQLSNVFPSLSLSENLDVGGDTLPRALRKERRERVLSLFPFLASRLSQKAGTLSGGERQLLALASALMPEPRFLLLDEPSAGLSPKATVTMFDKVRELRETLGLTILLVEQNVYQAFEISDRAYVLALGRNEVQGRPAELIQDERVRVAYLGGEPAADPSAP